MSNSRWPGYLIVDLQHDPAGLYDPQIQFSGTTTTSIIKRTESHDHKVT